MTIAGYKMMSPLMMFEILTEQQQEEEQRRREQNAKAGAFAHFRHATGVPYKDMTESQKAMANAVANRWAGKGSTENQGYGFKLDPRGRRPQR